MIEDKDIERLEKLFVTRQECNDINTSIDRKMGKTDVRLAVIEQQQKINNWMTMGIVGGIIALLINVYFGG